MNPSYQQARKEKSHDRYQWIKRKRLRGFPDGSVVKNLPAKAGHTGSIPDLGGCHVQWSTSAVTREVTTIRSPCTATREKPCWPQLRKLAHSNKDPVQSEISESFQKS